MDNVCKIQPAERLASVSEYYFSRKLKQIAELNAKGYDIVSLGIGGPDLPPPTEAIDTAIACLKRTDSHSYQMTVGLPELRQSFAEWYKKYYHVSIHDADKQILPLIGSKEGILNIALAFLNPGDGVLVPNPGYPTYTSASRIAQAEIFSYELCEDTGWLPDFDALEQLPLDRIKLMWVNYPHMPTGTPASRNLFERLVAFGKKHSIVIVNDNPYSFILNEKPLSILQIEGANGICIEINSLSKCLNMAGWRVGMLISNPTFVEWVLKVKSNIDSGQPRAIMEGAIVALRQEQEWYNALNATYTLRKQIAMQIMDTLGCRCKPGQQGLFLWGRIPDKEKDAESFADNILEQARVFITPGFIFGSAGNRYIRISLCAPIETLSKALTRIQRL